MKRCLQLVAYFVLLAAVRPTWAAKPVSCGADVGVNVQIAGTTDDPQVAPNDPPPLPLSYKLVSDGLGVYSNGSKGKGGTLSAILQISNCRYDFTLNLINLARKAFAEVAGVWVKASFFNFDRIGSVPVLTTDTDNNLTGAAQSFCGSPGGPNVIYDPNDPTKPKTESGVVFDNYGGCSADADHQWYVLRLATINTESGNLRYNVSPFEGFTAGSCPSSTDLRCKTSLVRVYHPDVNTWTLAPHDVPVQSPSPAPSPNMWVAAQMTEGTLLRYLSVPFKITVTRQ